MSKISNMINLLQILKDGKIHGIEELSEKIEVSKRMIRQYKLELEQTNIYINSVTGKYGGYQMDIENDFFRLDDTIKIDGILKLMEEFAKGYRKNNILK